MRVEKKGASGAGEAKGPSCPFCEAGWTQTMLAQYDALVDPNGCACCSKSAHDHEHATSPLPVPTADLCCASCGRAIFLAPSSI